MLLKSPVRRSIGAESSKLSYEGSTPSRGSTIREFASMKEAQDYLDWEYSLPLYKLAKHPTSYLTLVVNNTK